jgi:nitroreductase
MSGILFFKTATFDSVLPFYRDRIGMKVWLQQPDIAILKHGNLLLGLHRQPEADMGGLITFFYGSRDEVVAMHRSLQDVASTDPKRNDRYSIFHFFAHDPEGRPLEFQSFEHPVQPCLDAEELLATRRSIRSYDARPVPPDVLRAVFDRCACAPSARNTQPWEFVVTRDPARLGRLSAVRGDSSAPIARAPMAVAICTDPGRTPRPIEDACIAAYHFLLASWAYGLGTCWIGGMDRDDVKEILGVPRERYVATVTPLGYPAERPAMSERGGIVVREVG